MQHGSLINLIAKPADELDELDVGAYVTECMWTDRRVWQITARTAKTITLARATVTRVDGNGMSDAQTWAAAPASAGAPTRVARLTKTGWRVSGGSKIIAGAHEYHDFSF